ncbi:carboxylesterase/lipase family protein [Embleya sp. AB8]|uniref:carboxylesterase/lipase family protein n=1 Tax=Embleya sp. AB8 TaxID=3156304 RepID=UPI003C71929E
MQLTTWKSKVAALVATTTAAVLGLGTTPGTAVASDGGAPPGRAVRPASVVRTDSGALRGAADHGTWTFDGVPYAAPPVGDLRRRSPAPVTPWTGVRDATRPGNRAMQPADGSGLLPVDLNPGHTPRPMSEDSLDLNVRTPFGSHLPVLVWIHGGSFTGGSGAAYDTSALARKGIVVVSVNYRLGPLGFLADPSLDPEGTGGDYGLQDQQAALRWVKRNIAAFGGDPHRVTIAGESAGGISVAAHLVAPGSLGLFDAAVMESADASSTIPLETARQTGADYVTNVLGVPTGPDRARQLRDLDVRKITAAESRSATKLGYPIPLGRLPTYGRGSWLVSGGSVLPENPADAIRAGRAARVPVLTGTNKDEMRIFGFLMEKAGYPITDASYPGNLRDMGVPAALDRYPLTAGARPPVVLGTALTDAWVGDVRSQAHDLAKYAPVYAYEFADTAPALPGQAFDLGAYHTAELPYLFNVADLPVRLNAEQRRLSRQLIEYWANFVRTGDPNGPRVRTTWPTLPSAVAFRPGGTVVAHDDEFAAEHNWAFWRNQPFLR